MLEADLSTLSTSELKHKETFLILENAIKLLINIVPDTDLKEFEKREKDKKKLLKDYLWLKSNFL